MEWSAAEGSSQLRAVLVRGYEAKVVLLSPGWGHAAYAQWRDFAQLLLAYVRFRGAFLITHSQRLPHSATDDNGFNLQSFRGDPMS